MERLHEEYRRRQCEIVTRLADFSRVKGDDVFYELCFCLLTPQSNGKRCDEAVQILRERDFLNRDFPLAAVLRKKTRFHRHKAAYLRQLKTVYPDVKVMLDKEKNPFLLRQWFVERVNGMGMKEASHFLRNIGYRGLAILDRHILRHLFHCGVLQEVPRALTTKRYCDIEQQFLSFSKEIGIDMDELDLLFWSMATGEVFK